MRDVLLATRNRGKVQELKERLSGLPVRLHAAVDLGIAHPSETGSTFEANARIKALHYSRAVDWLVLADDSGLEIEVLGGEPGIHSARFGGPAATDAQRVKLILKKL